MKKVASDLRPQELYGHFFMDFNIEGLIHFPHTALSQFLYDLVAACK